MESQDAEVLDDLIIHFNDTFVQWHLKTKFVK